MKQVIKPAVVTMAICFFMVACDNEEKAEPANTDSTATTTATTTDATKDQSMDATTVAPGLYKLIKDTMGIRVLSVEYKPGYSSAMHSTPIMHCT
jgi:hypothetical protein